jgi:hypothetical protein
MADGGDEEPSEEEDDEAKCDLCGDQRAHRAAFGVRFFTAFECCDRLD